jgi:hypothetical protein
MALFVRESQQQISRYFTVEFYIPGAAARIPQRTVDRILVKGGRVASHEGCDCAIR